MENPFEKQAQFHFREAQKWKWITRIVGIILLLTILLKF